MLLFIAALPQYAAENRNLALFVSAMWIGFGLSFVGVAIFEGGNLTPGTTSRAASLFDPPNYQDRFSSSTSLGQYETVDEVVADWFRKQPAWLRAVSTNTLSKKKVHDALTDERYEVDHIVGSWEVFAHNNNRSETLTVLS